MSLTFNFLNIFFQCLSVSSLGSCSQLENLSFSSSEFKIINFDQHYNVVSNFDFEKIGFDIGCQFQLSLHSGENKYKRDTHQTK